MNGAEWMEQLLECEPARRRIPLGLQATLPLPGRKGGHSAECWYYRLECRPDGVRLYSPERYVLWDVRTMEIRKMESMEPVCLGAGTDLLTRAHREKEDAYLNGVLSDYLSDGKAAAEEHEVIDRWLEAAPQEMREWLSNALKGRE